MGPIIDDSHPLLWESGRKHFSHGRAFLSSLTTAGQSTSNCWLYGRNRFVCKYNIERYDQEPDAQPICLPSVYRATAIINWRRVEEIIYWGSRWSFRQKEIHTATDDWVHLYSIGNSAQKKEVASSCCFLFSATVQLSNLNLRPTQKLGLAIRHNYNFN